MGTIDLLFQLCDQSDKYWNQEETNKFENSGTKYIPFLEFNFKSFFKKSSKFSKLCLITSDLVHPKTPSSLLFSDM